MHIVKNWTPGTSPRSAPRWKARKPAAPCDKLAQMTPDVLLPAIHAIEPPTRPQRIPGDVRSQAPACGRKD
ncbi:MAG: hypothetical protein ACLT8E_03735 [Akkermansia sp.]